MADHHWAPSATRRYNTRLGLILFAIYLLLYLGFVLLNAFAAHVMEQIVLAGLNLAIVYGFGLIIVAFVMAIVYGMMCRNEPLEGPVGENRFDEHSGHAGAEQ